MSTILSEPFDSLLKSIRMTDQSNLREIRGKTAFWLRLRILGGLAVAFVILVVGSLIVFALGCLTLFQARRFLTEVVVRTMARAGLVCLGVRYSVRGTLPHDEGQYVYISNHSSSLDMLVITSLGLPRTRYFLSGFLQKILPVGLIGHSIGVFWTMSQQFPERRALLFQRAERTLRRTGESVFLTPEGQKIGHFNKGAFHLATSLGVPIQPMYIEIPTNVDPGPWSQNKDLDVRPGEVVVHIGPLIDTKTWTLENLETNRDAVRSRYAEWKNELQAARTAQSESKVCQSSLHAPA